MPKSREELLTLLNAENGLENLKMLLETEALYSSTSGLSPRGHLERQAEFHASTQDEA